MAPINDTDSMLDLMCRFRAPVAIATLTTLGTINHTLLTLNAVRQAGAPLVGVVMIGEENRNNRDAIEHYGQVPPLSDGFRRSSIWIGGPLLKSSSGISTGPHSISDRLQTWTGCVSGAVR